MVSKLTIRNMLTKLKYHGSNMCGISNVLLMVNKESMIILDECTLVLKVLQYFQTLYFLSFLWHTMRDISFQQF